jgi:2Fe-2S ferredoxin
MSEAQIINVQVIDREGEEHTLAGLEGWRLMEVIRDYGLPIKAECGGACQCATCHIYVDKDFLDKLPEREEEETNRLYDDAFDVEDNSRLSCQILLKPEMEGLRVTLAPEAD